MLGNKAGGAVTLSQITKAPCFVVFGGKGFDQADPAKDLGQH